VPTIDVSDGVWAYLQQHAERIDDSPSAILERLLGIPALPSMADGVSGPQPQGAFREPIVKVLGELGGRAPKREVLARLATTVPLTDADRQQNIRGERRWERRISSAAAEMRRDGILGRTQHGVWALAGATGSET
jgi:hypothetical protein